ncbi:MAG: DUF4402 domain-containing protein [Bacteroidales bacterium]|nr:DUF4402 domain-containing protein [Bacteroidales bacterium]
MNSLKSSLLVLVLLTSMGKMCLSQTIDITNTQNLNFGTFCQTDDAGGTVTVSNTGTRSSTGNIAPIGQSFSYAVFTITTDSVNQFSLQIDKPLISISGSNGGSMSLQIGTANPEFPSLVVGYPATVYIGGTLTIGTRSENPAGSYNGNYLLYFNFYYE